MFFPSMRLRCFSIYQFDQSSLLFFVLLPETCHLTIKPPAGSL